MKKEIWPEKYFRNVREELIKVPLQERKKWETPDLYLWWLEARKNNSFLILTGMLCGGWKFIPGMCHDLFGCKAIC